MVQFEEPFSVLNTQGFFNNIYNNAQDIIGWNTNKGKNNVERGMAVTVDASDVGTVRGNMSEGKVNMVKGKYSPIPSRL